MLSNADMERIQAEAHASVLVETMANEPFAAGPMIRELRDLIRMLPDNASLHALLGFCLKRIECRTSPIDSGQENDPDTVQPTCSQTHGFRRKLAGNDGMRN